MAGPERLRAEELTADSARAHRPSLVALLQDVVEGGASVGFLPPLGAGEAAAYWESVSLALKGGRRLWIARDADGGIVGTVQLDLERRANGDHRAEVTKLMVVTSARRRGVGRMLMDSAEALYRGMGWQPAGVIPRYARSADGTLHATVFYYKLLDPLTGERG